MRAALGALLAVLVGLKAGGAIAWSWWWVLTPLWLPSAVLVLVFGPVVAGLVVTTLVVERGSDW